MSLDPERIERAVRELLIGIGEDPDREGLQATPRRVASMYEELFAGLDEDPSKYLTLTFAAEHDEMVMVRDIPFASLCEHHLVPFMGKAHVAYIPGDDGRITGLSKLARLVDAYRQAPAGPGADDLSDRRHPHGSPRAQGCARRRRGRASVHVDARRQEAGHPHRHLGASRDIQRRPEDTRRSDGVRPRSLSAGPDRSATPAPALVEGSTVGRYASSRHGCAQRHARFVL